MVKNTKEQIKSYMRSHRILSVLIFFSGLFVISVVGRTLYAQTIHRVFLLWNLFLAWIPFLVLIPLSSKKNRVLSAILFIVWFIFLPNTLYTITDLKHIGFSNHFILYWLDLFLLFGIAVLGTSLGILSLEDGEKKLTEQYGRRFGKIVRISAIILCGFGVYLGRFPRLNSWHLFTHPISTIKSIATSLHQILISPYDLFFVCIFSFFYWLLYTVYREYKKI